MLRRCCSMSLLIVFSAGLLTMARPSAAQQPPPIPGVTGTLALEGTVDKTYAGANAIAVTTANGIRHLFHLNQRTVVHGAAGSEAAFKGVTVGSRVVVHYAMNDGEKTAVEVDHIAADGLHEMKGVVTRVDRGAKQLSIRLADGSDETLQLSDRAAKDVGKDIDRAVDESTVVVYYSEEAVGKVAHYFRRIGVN
jgi:hypothetical protein